MKRILLILAALAVASPALQAAEPDVNRDIEINIASGNVFHMLSRLEAPRSFSWHRVSGNISFSDQKHTEARLHGCGQFEFVYTATYYDGQKITVDVTGKFTNSCGGGDNGGTEITIPDEP